ncbi:MAG: hypothetical protein AB1403_02085 [Candidatus Riflebacteria bacterium]
MISTIVMTMILASVIGFIHSGSELWRKGYGKIDAQNYKRATFELIKADLMKAYRIEGPLASTTSQITEHALHYSMTIHSNERCDFRIHLDSDNSLIREIASVAYETNYNIRIARNVASFSVTRISTWTVQVFLEIGTDPDDYGDRETISSDTMVFTAPMAG